MGGGSVAASDLPSWCYDDLGFLTFC
jgi:hypothetical protein